MRSQTRRMRHFLILVTILICSSCIAQDPYVVLKGEPFTVELAETREKQALGLMFRDSMPEDHGMLFVFPGEARRSFWMKNTRIPLDIFYFDENLALVSVAENAVPCRTRQCPAYPSKAPAKFVLELNAGKAAELDVRAGDLLELHLD
ncbi:MAG: DUF192 domain-containing protein [Xanthomonadales bacterium]|nr:DUF192 domain-containing protein [Gammaproteobacteria bacterium]MBT8053570.1 DUF192 domain-containing protein [Gammaproteobacteria bacterium]NND57949.1 DUF192 domain-containing protein [Xanthomonadales bacterium]NNK50885.1 DUF192 domain-containing protein [Xanthomonadales bacterium]